MLKAQRSIKIAEIDKPEHKAITLNKRKGKVRRRTVPTPGAPTRPKSIQVPQFEFQKKLKKLKIYGYPNMIQNTNLKRHVR